MRDAVDFVAAPFPGELAKAGLDACPYTGNARPCQAWFDECRALGVGIPWMTQETVSERSQQGFQAGVLDCRFAESRAAERGHGGAIAVVVSDGNRSDAWDASPYGQGWASVASVPFFGYGATGVIATFERGAACPLLIPGGWIPETWGAGAVAAQLVGAQASISTPHDLNRVFYDFGASPPSTHKWEFDMLIRNTADDHREAVSGYEIASFRSLANMPADAFVALDADEWAEYHRQLATAKAAAEAAGPGGAATPATFTVTSTVVPG